ncbi:Phosphatidylinositol 4-phosphate 5-kinase type-1 beta [Eumeta japonica]|uniref:Phosphatidylinositol 4-phosphate 5-kinase type-1 beta n=1 Tax=Eumeta variegata TaxID=151549 RepID=A0A4C2AEJ8_EUMVA|nr:Phosphatidylinositol 4-phosphate 5-kinase type-1 beta [Eumeta japonica]
MDYSLLVGIHNLDLAAKEKREERIRNARAKLQRADEIREADESPDADQIYNVASSSSAAGTALNRSRSMNRQRLVAHSTAMESITADIDTPFEEDNDIPAGGIPARSENDERLILYIGIIDILQSYRLEKKLEHTFKSIIYNGDTVSVCRPSFYAQRFQNFMGKTVFKKTPTFPLKHSPSKRKASNATARTPLRTPTQSVSSNIRPPLMSGSSTPPPAFDDISEEDITANSSTANLRNSSQSRILMPQRSYMSSHRSTLGSTTDDYSDDELASATGSTRSPMQRKKPQLHLSKTSVQITTVGCIEDHHRQHNKEPDHKHSDEGIEQDVEGKNIITSKSTIIQATKEQIYTSTLVVNDILQQSLVGSDDNPTTSVNIKNPANQQLLNKNQTTASLTNDALHSYFSQQPRHKQHTQSQQPFQKLGGSTYHSLDLNQYKSHGGNLSRIQEVDDEHNISKVSWEKHYSPGSLRSQDSGFSDNDEFHCTRSSSDRSPKANSPSSKSIKCSASDKGSPSSVISVQTPPTVIRRVGNSEFYTSLVNVSRRISFSCSPTSNRNTRPTEEVEGSTLMEQLDSMNC